MRKENYDAVKRRHAQMDTRVMSIEELLNAYAEALSGRISVSMVGLAKHVEVTEKFFWDVMIVNIKQGLGQQGYDLNNLVPEEYIRSQMQDLYDLAQDISDLAKASEPQPARLGLLSQKELAEMLKSLLVDVDKNLPKIREIFMHLTLPNLSIIRHQLRKNPDRYQKAITVIEAISRTKFGY